MQDTHSRTLAKALTWRAWCFAVGYVVLVMLGQSWSAATMISLTFMVVMTVSYYAHERIWNRVVWGQKPCVVPECDDRARRTHQDRIQVLMQDTHSRTLAKALTWRSWGFMSGVLILLMFGQDLWTATAYSVIVNLFLTISYYFHERMWVKIIWGRR